MTLKHVSHSSLVCADSCLKQFQLTRLSEEKLPEMPSGPRDIGILVHRFIEAYFKGEDFIAALAEQRSTNHYAEALGVFENWRSRFTIPESNWLFTERRGTTLVAGVPVPVLGFDDFIYEDAGTHVLRDFKTGWGTEVYESYSFQGDLACLRYSDEFPGIPLASEVEFVRRGIVSPRREWTDELRAATIARVQAIWQRILSATKANFFPAAPGRHCGFCDYRTTCGPARALDDARLVILSPEVAEAAKGEIELMQTALKHMRAALKTYCGENPE